MTYKECLNFIKENGVIVKQLEVADNVDGALSGKIKDYEGVCKYIYSCSLETDLISVATLCECFRDMLDDGYTEEEILELREYQFIDKASYY